MKTIAKIMVSAAMALTFTPSLLAEQVSVTLTEAGTLAEAVGEENLMEVTSLKVAGPMNGTDLKTLRAMLGMTDFWKPTDGQLTEVDLTDAIMVAGGDDYATAPGSESSSEPIWMPARDGALPENLFSRTNLKSIKLPKSITGIYSSFNKAYALTGTIDIPEGVTFLGEYAFANSGIEGINLPSTLKDGADKYSFNKSAIGTYAFAGCASLRSITFPAGVTLLKTCVFMDCVSLTEMHIPITITEIGSNAFCGCSGIKDFWVDSPVPPKAEWEAFKYMNFSDCVLHVQAGSELTFAAADEWMDFESIRGIGASTVKATVTTDAPDFSGVEIYADGAALQLPEDAQTIETEIYIGSRIKVYERETHRMLEFVATGAKTSRKDDGAYSAVITEDGAVITFNYEELVISVETMSTYLNGVLCGSLKMRYDGEEVTYADMKVGEVVEFIPVAQPGYGFSYVTRVYDGSDDSADYCDTYTASKLDADEPVIFKGVFYDLSSLESVATESAGLRLEGSVISSKAAVGIYSSNGMLVRNLPAGEFDTRSLARGNYIAVSGRQALKFVVD